ncbi:MAG: metallophosphoesterase [Kiritimatiellae bacterium]|nr:metallophosphoesterase [Kiritimatiellia bacterium]
MWKLVFQVLPIVAWCASCLVVVWPLSLSRRGALAASAALAAAFGKFAFFAVAGGDGFNPDLPSAVIWFYGWAYAAAMMLTMAACPFALADVALRLCRRPPPVRTRRVRAAALAALAAAISAWGICESASIPSVRRVEIAFRDLPPAFDGYRIVHMSDLHCSTAARRGRFERIVERVNALDADLIAITGDFVDGDVPGRYDDLAPIARLKAKDGVFGCAGNHERYWDWPRWSEVFMRWNVRLLSGDADCNVIRRGSEAIALGGLLDPAFFEGDVPAAAGAFRGAPKDAFRILLFHRPLAAAAGAAAADVRLQLSGHTHGGAMPLVSRLVARVNEGRTRGLYEFAEGRYLYVSPGTGQWAGFPLRLLNPAEITEITLRRAASVPPRQGRRHQGGSR